VRAGCLQFHTVRPSLHGLESHLVDIYNRVLQFEPDAVVMDPITNLQALGDGLEIKAMLTRALDFLKARQITTIFTTLTEGSAALEQSGTAVSSLMDTWVLLRMIESAGERNRLLYILKSRGMAHSNQMREFVLSQRGIDLVDVYTGPGVVHTGTERLNQEARDKATALAAQQAAAHHAREIEQERLTLEAQLTALQAKLANLESQHIDDASDEAVRLEAIRNDRATLSRARNAV
jgi:circadian clock protein KaiC